MEEVPLIKALNARYSDDAVIVGISIDASLERAERTIKEKGMTWPQLADGRGFDGPVPTAYHVQGTPTIFVVDRAGNIFATPTSAKRLEEPLQQAIQAAR